jgi:GTP 3',8-cyclase
MYDSFNRTINYLRVSVTDRCNLRCRYCMPEEGVPVLHHNDILSFEEIAGVVRYGISKGINKVRLTGGEPLVRKGIVDLVRMLSPLDGLSDLSLTTNGVLLEEYAVPLAEAGLHRINVSLDTVDPERFREITRFGSLERVLRGIETAAVAGLAPVKINCVIREDVNEPDAAGVAAWGRERGMEVRFIHLMDLHAGHFSKVIGGEGGDCATCNRLRLTANGKIKPCLFNDREYDIRTMGIPEAFDAALLHKPACGSINTTGAFYNIGG